MAKDGNTFAKRQRETLNRLKAEDKRRRRQQRKDQPSSYNAAPMEPPVDEPGEVARPTNNRSAGWRTAFAVEINLDDFSRSS